MDTYYVSPHGEEGSDTKGDGSLGAPFKTLARALREADQKPKTILAGPVRAGWNSPPARPDLEAGGG